MFDFIKGKLAKASTTEAVVENNGIGYKLLIPLNYLTKLPELSSPVCFYTSVVTRELSQTIYGFFTEEERTVFEILITISGIGPKTALSIIGNLRLEDLHNAIYNQDVKMLSNVPGIGKKTAERLLIEMKDKLPPLSSKVTEQVSPTNESHLIGDAIKALTNLGYQHFEARKVIEKIIASHPEEELNLPQLISAALKHRAAKVIK